MSNKMLIMLLWLLIYIFGFYYLSFLKKDIDKKNKEEEKYK